MLRKTMLLAAAGLLLLSTGAFAADVHFKSNETFASAPYWMDPTFSNPNGYIAQHVVAARTAGNNSVRCATADISAFGTVDPAGSLGGAGTCMDYYICALASANIGSSGSPVICLSFAGPVQDNYLIGTVKDDPGASSDLQVNAPSVSAGVAAFDAQGNYVGPVNVNLNLAFKASRQASTVTTWEGHLQQRSGSEMINMTGSGTIFLSGPMLSGTVSGTLIGTGISFSYTITPQSAVIGSNKDTEVTITHKTK